MTAKLTIEEMQEIAKSRGGKCLSTKYVNSKTKLYWECAEGHRWNAIPESVKSGTWCKICRGSKGKEKLKLTITEMQAIAQSRGGKCLSSKYVNNNTNLDWECSEGHRWSATPGNIKAGKWCRVCSYAKRKKVITQTY